MKKTLVLIVLLLVAVWGCSDNNSITGPANQSNLSVADNVTAQPNWVKLPAPKYPRLLKSFSLTQRIAADQDCNMIINESYEDVDGNQVNVWAKITFLAGTLNENTEITMAIDDETGVLTFLPRMMFNKNAILSVIIKAPLFVGLRKSDVNFVYFSEDGYYESVDFDKIKINPGQGRVQLDEAELPHFSRYGFCR